MSYNADIPLVSVTIPVLNGEKYLTQAIGSLLAQSFPSWELLIIDDGSSDRTAEIADGYSKSDPSRICVLHHPDRANRGMIESRNLGLEHSRGRYVARLDADDVLRPNALEDQVAILESHPEAAMVYGPAEIWKSWTGSGEDEFQGFSVPLDAVIRPPQVLSALLASGGDEPVGMFVRRTVLEEVRGYSGLSLHGDLYEDIALNVKLCLKYPVFASSRSWYRYRQHQESYCAVAKRRGEYDTGARLFLEWVESYLDQLGVSDATVWRALRYATRSEWQRQIDSSRNECATLVQKKDDAEHLCLLLQQQQLQLQKKIEDLQSQRWRLTAPLRAVKNKFLWRGD
jgi:glycosyltransferase involved in cell wall biosynthesis